MKGFLRDQSKVSINNTYKEFLITQLGDRDLAIAYLNAALQESLEGEEDSHTIFLVALRNVIQAQMGMGEMAKKIKVSRESLYKTLSENGNPEWNSFISLLRAMKINLRIVAK